MQFNPNAGVAGNIQSWEQQLGLHPGNLDSLGATQGQQQAFGHALAGYGQGQPGQGYHGGQGGQGGGQGGGGQQAGQVPPQAGQMPYQVPPPPQGYSPGYHNPNQPQFQPPPQSYSPGYQNPNLVQQPQQPAPQQQMAPQGGMPPFQGASPGQAGPQGPSPTAGQAGPQGGPQGTDRFGFQPLQLPGWQSFINGYNQEMPQQPTYLTGEGLAQWQGYESALQNQLAGLQAQYGRLAPEYNQQGQRLMTNYDTERGQLGGNLAQSGIFNSGVAQQAFQNQQTDYNRQFQDLQSAAQDQLGGYYSQAGSAFDQTMQQLLALERQQAGQQAQNPNAPYQQPRPKKPTPKRNKKG
jgi:hypothetical protein